MGDWIKTTWVWCRNCMGRETHFVLPDGRLKCEVCGTVQERPMTRRDLERWAKSLSIRSTCEKM
jgi:uncharacterized Zn finger protein